MLYHIGRRSSGGGQAIDLGALGSTPRAGRCLEMQADEEVRPEVEKIAPDSVIASVANASGQMQRYNAEIEQIRLMRHRNFLAALHQVEVSLIPFPDEPPIVYPSAEKWEEISRSNSRIASMLECVR